MKYMHLGALMGLWLASGGASAAGIECGENGGRIVDSHAAVVWVALEGAPIPVTDDPEAQAALAAQTGAPVLSPDDLCLQGWVLPAPHPVEPVPTPQVPPMGGRPIAPRPVTLNGPVNGVDFAGADVHAATGKGADSAGDEVPDAEDGDDAEGIADTTPSVIIAASDEPTPTPATPAPSLQVKSAGGCSTTNAPSVGLWALLLLGGLRRRRGER
jgi:uncharacterized protein (TIGR03382 family)